MKQQANLIIATVAGNKYEIAIARNVSVAGSDEKVIDWITRRVFDLLNMHSPGFGDAISYVSHGLRETSWISSVQSSIAKPSEGVVY